MQINFEAKESAGDRESKDHEEAVACTHFELCVHIIASLVVRVVVSLCHPANRVSAMFPAFILKPL